MLWHSASDAAIRAHTVLRLESEEQHRRSRFADRHRLLEGDYEDLVKAEVRRIFADPTQADRVAILGDSSVNVFRYVVDEVGRFTGARRRFVSGGNRDETYERICDTLEPFDLISQEILTALVGCNDVLVRILPSGRTDGLRRPNIRVFRPHEVSVKYAPENPSEIEEVAYERLTADGKVEVVVWTRDLHYVVPESGIARAADGAPNTKNPYGRIPFVAVHAGLRSDRFWDCETGEDQYRFTLAYLAGWSSVRFLLHQQSHKQLAAIGVDDTWTPPAKTGPGTIWKIPFVGGAQQRIEAIDLQTDPTKLVDTLERNLAQHLASKGLNPDQLGQNPGQAPASGLALYLDRQRVLERRKRFNPFMVEAEYEVAELYRWAWNLTHSPIDHIDPDAEFEVELIEETVVMSPRETEEYRSLRLQNIQTERDLGLRSEAEQLAEYREISVDEAEELIRSRGTSAPTPAPQPPQE